MPLEHREFANGRIVGCRGEGVSFRGSKFDRVHILAEKAERTSFARASFDRCRLTDCVIGPGTLDLQSTTWRGATLKEVRFDFGQLAGADFTDASLTNVYFRSADLRGVSFRGAKLRKVSFEKAALGGADFTRAELFKMDFWGEPDWTGAIIPDELRYQFGELKDPMRRVEGAIQSPGVDAVVREALVRLKATHPALLSAPECMLIGREMADIIDPALFPRVLKTLKTIG
jgi:hypothetical protein